jgi:hypothetical protein
MNILYPGKVSSSHIIAGSFVPSQAGEGYGEEILKPAMIYKQYTS